MADKFGSGLQMGMQMARDVRSANVASADRRERSNYRERAETREDRLMDLRESKEGRDVSAEKRAVSESGARLKSLKKGMRRGRKADDRADSAEDRAVDAADMIQKINKQKLKNARNPAITLFNNYKGLLEEYQKNSRAAVQRFAGELAPVNKALTEAKMSFTASESVPNLVAMRDQMVADHKDFMHGLEQSFMAASNRPHEGKWSIRPSHDMMGAGVSYGVVFEGGNQAEAESAFNAIKAMGGRVGVPNDASAATPAANPNDPGGIRRPTAP